MNWKSIEALEPLLGRISALLQEPSSSRSAAAAASGLVDATWRRSLSFLESELTTVVAMMRPLAEELCDVDDRDIGNWVLKWNFTGSLADEFLDFYGGRHLGQICRSWRVRMYQRRYKRIVPEFQDIVKLVVLLCDFPSRYKHDLLVAAVGDVHSSVADADASSGGLVGMDGSREKLVRWLMADDTKKLQVKVVAIFGFAGVGKTALAMEVYKQIQIVGGQEFFECRARAKVSQRPDMNKLFEHILSQVHPEGYKQYISGDERKQKLLQQLVRDFLQHKRYLIVLDDIWDSSHWDVIKPALPNNSRGSRIMIITPIKTVALSCCSGFNGLVHKVKPLDELDSKRLFLTKVFGSKYSCPDHLEQICNEILRKCDGIPLFIVAMADSLKKQMKVQSSTICKMVQVTELKQVEQTLSVGYDNLPFRLKLFSLYVSMYPHDYKIEKIRLLRKWVAEGFIESSVDFQSWRGMEEEAENHFSELINRNVIQLVNCKYNSEVEMCQVHNFMNQLLVSKAAELNFLATSKTLNSTTSNKIRHISLHYPDQELPTVLERLDLSYTRSLTIFDEADNIPLDKFIYLTVLDVEGWKNFKNGDLLDICKLSLLKYLSLRNTPVSKLPSQIKELCYLQVMDTSQTQISELPPEACQLRLLEQLYLGQTKIRNVPLQIKDLHNLETLDISQTQISELPPEAYQLEQLEALYLSHTPISNIPSLIKELHSLRTLDIRRTQISQVPKQIIQLRYLSHLLVGGDNSDEGIKIKEGIRFHHYSSLQTLATVDLSECSASAVEGLGDLKNLRTLAIVWPFEQSADRRYQESLLSSLKKWYKLKSLTIHCEFSCSMEFLAYLSDPPLNLEKLNVTGRFVRAPQWFERLKHLAFLQVRVCKLGTEDLKILGDLPRLECLVLGLEFLPEKEIVIEKGRFLQLRRFSVDCRVAWMTFEEDAMWKLTDLELKFSTGPPNQRSIPLGIEHLICIKHVGLQYSSWCADTPSVKATVDSVRKAVGKHYNHIKLVINGEEENVQANSDSEASLHAGPSVLRA